MCASINFLGGICCHLVNSFKANGTQEICQSQLGTNYLYLLAYLNPVTVVSLSIYIKNMYFAVFNTIIWFLKIVKKFWFSCKTQNLFIEVL